MATLSSHLLNSVNGTHAEGVKVIIYQINPNGDKKNFFETETSKEGRILKDFDLSKEELMACDKLIKTVKDEILAKDKSVKGFNLGTNIGKVSGQSILHCHFHLIPRREGDVENPQGGVRSVIPNKQHYKRKK